MILTDPPYGSTNAYWDRDVDLDKMWIKFLQVGGDDTVYLLTATQPFAAKLITHNIKMFKHEWIWDKVIPVGHLTAKYRPMQRHESILVFSKGACRYYPIKTLRDKPVKGREYKRSILVRQKAKEVLFEATYMDKYPQSIIVFSKGAKKGFHPTRKPIELFEYLIKTYTKEGDSVLDPFVGSGATLIAAKRLGRKATGIELEKQYIDVALQRLSLENDL